MLAGLYLFNLSGYFLYYKYSIYQSDKKLITELDNHLYEESELMELKIPLNLPYMTSQNNFERIDGEFQHEGVYYNYVERKVSNDTLYLKCRPNNQKTVLYRSLTEFAKKVHDIPHEKGGNGSTRKIVLASEYVPHYITFHIVSPKFKSGEHKSGNSKALPESFIPDFFKPPRLFS